MVGNKKVHVLLIGKLLLCSSLLGAFFINNGMAKIPAKDSGSVTQPTAGAPSDQEPEAAPVEIDEIEGPPADLAPAPPMEPPPIIETAVEQPPATVRETTVAEAPPGGSALTAMKAFGGLGLVLCLIAGCFFAARKFAPQYFARHTGGKNLQLLETLPMGEKRSIVLVQAGGKRLLLGSTAQQITLLAQMDESLALPSEGAPAATPAADSKKDTSLTFRNIYNLEKGRGNHPPGKAKTIAPDVRAKMKQLRESLER